MGDISGMWGKARWGIRRVLKGGDTQAEFLNMSRVGQARRGRTRSQNFCDSIEGSGTAEGQNIGSTGSAREF